jgi:hypothetical protein
MSFGFQQLDAAQLIVSSYGVHHHIIRRGGNLLKPA